MCCRYVLYCVLSHFLTIILLCFLIFLILFFVGGLKSDFFWTSISLNQIFGPSRRVPLWALFSFFFFYCLFSFSLIFSLFAFFSISFSFHCRYVRHGMLMLWEPGGVGCLQVSNAARTPSHASPEKAASKASLTLNPKPWYLSLCSSVVQPFGGCKTSDTPRPFCDA